MKIDEVFRVFWVKAIEDCDHSGKIVPFFLRDEIRQHSERSFSLRAERILDWVGKSKNPDFKQPPLPLKPLWVACFLLVALVCGLCTNLLGDKRSVHIVLNPFAVLWLWNMVVILLQLIFFNKSKRVFQLPGVFGQKLLFKRLSLLWKVRWTFMAEMRRAMPQFINQKLVSLFHLGAIAILAGAIVGLYIRGLLLHYTFTWESTFFSSPELLQSTVDIFFLPASSLSGLPIPRLSEMGVQMNGAVWIHLFAVTSLLYVIVPRGLLLVLGQIRQMKTRPGKEMFSDLYFRRLVVRDAVTALTYGFAFEEEDKLGFAKCLGRVESIHWVFVPWGEEKLDMPSHAYLIFHASQTPEQEIHGQFLETVDTDSAELILWKGDRGFSKPESRIALWERLFKHHHFKNYQIFFHENEYGLESKTL
ncbi:MAG: hypothetical protein CR997_01105 [Acidobacteria bacterium]|nr:MAG: hypothetical protein CR997_01105 [Acidobacteriota bacterium]